MDEKNELVIANKYEMKTSLFDDNGRKEFCSFNPNNEEEMNIMLRSDSKADFKLNDEVGQVITVIGVRATEREEQDFDDSTGEEIVRKKHTLMLFDEEGKSHVTGSNACYKSFERIILIKKYLPTKEKPMKLEVITEQAQVKGHEYLKLRFVE